MSRRMLNLGIVAHVDAGKTTLTERLLYTAGVIERPGSVDAGTTQTDSLPLERRRGITIKSAVVSFPIGDVTVNLIDTPGHPDFIAEVERALAVLDGAVLVISAVEGVQPQTRILARALGRLRIPALLYVNKIDRPGASDSRVLGEIADRLRLSAAPVGVVHGLGTRDAGFTWSGASEGLAQRSGRALAYPVFFGSAITGAGVGSLMAGIAELLPSAVCDPDGPVSGTVFKIERDARGEKIVYVRMFSGTVRVRDRLRIAGDGREPAGADKVTAIEVFERGPAARRPSVSSGEIGKLRGLRQARVGDRIGHLPAVGGSPEFPRPALESVVTARDPAERTRLRSALSQLAEQDPLINVRQDEERQEIYVSLYGEVQQEVIAATLADDFGLAVTFRETTVIYIERPVGTASAAEFLRSDTHPFSATVGLRVEPAPVGAGVEFRLEVDPRRVPLYIYKTRTEFVAAMTRYVRHALEWGLHGWEVTDCVVTMTECGYFVGDGPRKHELPTPRTSSADFRKLTPVVLMTALRRAGTVVCEPMARVRVETPSAGLGGVLSVLARLGATVQTPSLDGEMAVVEAVLTAARTRDLRHQLPGLTSGEGTIESRFGGYQPVRGRFPSRPRPRADPSPLDRERYLAAMMRRA